jgi:hypothetical protein
VVIEFGMSLLKSNGLFIAFTPNGSEEYRISNKQLWKQAWGAVHPNFLDSKYYENIFYDKSFMISSSPYNLDVINEWRIHNSYDSSKVRLDGPELLILTKK